MLSVTLLLRAPSNAPIDPSRSATAAKLKGKRKGVHNSILAYSLLLVLDQKASLCECFGHAEGVQG
jgi:hypothetical protein